MCTCTYMHLESSKRKCLCGRHRLYSPTLPSSACSPVAPQDWRMTGTARLLPPAANIPEAPGEEHQNLAKPPASACSRRECCSLMLPHCMNTEWGGFDEAITWKWKYSHSQVGICVTSINGDSTGKAGKIRKLHNSNAAGTLISCLDSLAPLKSLFLIFNSAHLQHPDGQWHDTPSPAASPIPTISPTITVSLPHSTRPEDNHQRVLKGVYV